MADAPRSITEMESRAPYADSLKAKAHEAEQGRWYFQRYVSHLPTAGEIVLFDYTEARNALSFYTDTPEWPWTVVNSNEKRRARVESIRTVLHALDDEAEDLDVARAPDHLVVQPAAVLAIPTDDDPLGRIGGPSF